MANTHNLACSAPSHTTLPLIHAQYHTVHTKCIPVWCMQQNSKKITLENAIFVHVHAAYVPHITGSKQNVTKKAEKMKEFFVVRPGSPHDIVLCRYT